MRLFAFPGIANLELREDCRIEPLGRLGRRLALLYQRQAQLEKLLTPGIARFIDVGVRQHIVEENVLRDANAPGQLLAAPVGQIDVLEQKVGVKGAQIVVRHVGDEKGHPLALLARRVLEGLLQFWPIVAGPRQCLLDLRRPVISRIVRGEDGREREQTRRHQRAHG